MTLADYVHGASRVYIIGNGGSYANCFHMCNDFLSCGIRAYSIDPATLSAFANDYGYENAYAKWLSVVGEEGDLLIAMSGSGKSPNILNAIDKAMQLGMDIATIFGNERGEDMQQAEEAQLNIGHSILKGIGKKQ